MSSSLNIAIRARLIGTEDLGAYPTAAAAQQTLATLLAKEKDGTTPVVRKGNLATEVVYPCITFRAGGGLVDRRFAHKVAMGNPVIDMELWTDKRGGLTLPDIEKPVLTLLDMRLGCAPALPLEDGKVFWSELLVEPYDDYDTQRKAFFELLRFRVTRARVHRR